MAERKTYACFWDLIPQNGGESQIQERESEFDE